MSTDAGDAADRDPDSPAPDPSHEGFIESMLRDATITGLPGETGAAPEEPHAPEARQDGDEPVCSERPSEDEQDA